MRHVAATRPLAAAGLLTMTALAGTACGSTSGGTTSGGATSGSSCSVSGDKIALVGPLAGNPTLALMAQGFKDEAAKDGFNGENLLAADADVQHVVALGDQALAQNVKGMVILPFAPAMYPFVQKAIAAHIPVVVTHFPVSQTDTPGLTQDIVTDVAAYGKAAADAIGGQVGGKGSVAITQGSFNTTENLAATSFTSEMNTKYPGVTVLAPQVEGFDPPTAISKAVSIIQANPTIVGAFSTTGGGPTTWSGAEDQTGHKLTVIGMDYTRPNLDDIKAGKVYAVVGQPIYQEHQMAVDTIRDVICGKSVPFAVHPPSPIITQADLSTYYALNDRVGH